MMASGEGEDKEGDAFISEEVLQRLKEAESEAAELRKQLADMKEAEAESEAASPPADAKKAVPNNPAIKVDSVTSRENFLYPKNDVWLGEAKAAQEFMARDGLSESAYQSGVRPEDQPVVLRRLLLGLGATGLAAALGAIPTEKLDLSGAPKQPLFALLVPILEALQQFAAIEEAITYAQWGQVQASVSRILKNPTNLKAAMIQVSQVKPRRVPGLPSPAQPRPPASLPSPSQTLSLSLSLWVSVN